MMIEKSSIDDVDLSGKQVFIRVDLNVPLRDGRVADDERIRACLPTLRALRQRQCRLVLASHLGRPKGKRSDALSLRPVGLRLAELLGCPVMLATDCTGPETEALTAKLGPGECLLLENLRFHPEEESNDEAFSRQLAALAESYVNDAFSASHRRHASVVGITAHFPTAVAGLLMQRELKALSRLIQEPPKPYAVVLGGAKVSDKIPLIEALLLKVDEVLIGGAMAYPFLSSRGVTIGRSLLEPGTVDAARKILARAEELGVRVHLPVDHRVVADVRSDEPSRPTVSESIGTEMAGVDIGPRTETLFAGILRECRCILWNGPLGFFERGHLAGSRAVAGAALASGAYTVAGGGDTAALLHTLGVAGDFSHLSTGGGASIEFLSGRTLPGVQALNDR